MLIVSYVSNINLLGHFCVSGVQVHSRARLFGAIFCKLQSYIKGKLGTLDWDYTLDKSLRLSKVSERIFDRINVTFIEYSTNLNSINYTFII